MKSRRSKRNGNHENAEQKRTRVPTIDERLKQITLKIERAKKHVSDVEQSIRAFLDTKPYIVAANHHPKSRKLIYYVASVEPTPDDLALIAGDAVQNLMSALDHLAYQLVCSDTRDNPPNPNWIYFPIAGDAAKYEANKRGKIKGAAQATFDAIDAIKPYKGGNDALWMLYRLNNVEKHRLLMTVGSIFQSVDLGAHVTAHMRKSFPELADIEPYQSQILVTDQVRDRVRGRIVTSDIGPTFFNQPAALSSQPHPSWSGCPPPPGKC